jgi:ferrous iron transport protein A
MMPLAMVNPGSRVKLVSVNGGRGISARLAAMGLLPGVEVEVVSKDPGGPFILEVKGSRLVIGRGMALKIVVS